MNLCPHRRALACAGGALGAWFNASVGVCGLYLMITTMTIDEICYRQLDTGNGEMYLNKNLYLIIAFLMIFYTIHFILKRIKFGEPAAVVMIPKGFI